MSSLTYDVPSDLCLFGTPYEHRLFEQHLCVLGKTVMEAAVHPITQRLLQGRSEAVSAGALLQAHVRLLEILACMLLSEKENSVTQYYVSPFFLATRKFRPKLRTSL